MNWTEEDLTRHLHRHRPQLSINRLPARMERAIISPPAVSKYRSRRTQVICSCRGELWFHSAKEAGRYQELRLLEAGGAITDLELQPAFDLLVPGGEVVMVFHADFRYFDVATGKMIIEDVKSTATTQDRAWYVRKRWAEACHHIKIVNPYAA